MDFGFAYLDPADSALHFTTDEVNCILAEYFNAPKVTFRVYIV